VPAVAVIQEELVLFVITERKGCVGCFVRKKNQIKCLINTQWM